MKDFDIRKFLTENQITAAAQQNKEEERPVYMDPGDPRSSPVFANTSDKGYIPDAYHIFVVKFKDGDVLIGMDDKGMGGLTAKEWWEKSLQGAVSELQRLRKTKDQNVKDTAQAEKSTKDLNKLTDEEIGSLSPLARKINDVSLNIVGKEDEETADKILMKTGFPQLVDRAPDRAKALVKYDQWVSNARNAVGEDNVLNTDSEDSIDKRISKATDKKQDALDAREKKKQFGSGNSSSDGNPIKTSSGDSDPSQDSKSKEDSKPDPQKLKRIYKSSLKAAKEAGLENEKDADDYYDKLEEEQEAIYAEIRRITPKKDVGKTVNQINAELADVKPKIDKLKQRSDALKPKLRALEKYFRAKKAVSDANAEINEGHRRWNKLKEYFNIK